MGCSPQHEFTGPTTILASGPPRPVGAITLVAPAPRRRWPPTSTSQANSGTSRVRPLGIKING